MNEHRHCPNNGWSCPGCPDCHEPLGVPTLQPIGTTKKVKAPKHDHEHDFDLLKASLRPMRIPGKQ